MRSSVRRNWSRFGLLRNGDVGGVELAGPGIRMTGSASAFPADRFRGEHGFRDGSMRALPERRSGDAQRIRGIGPPQPVGGFGIKRLGGIGDEIGAYLPALAGVERGVLAEMAIEMIDDRRPCRGRG